MKKAENPHPKKVVDASEDYDNLYTVNSGSYTDCTGLMYKPPMDDFEYVSYTDVYRFRPSREADFYEDNK